MKNELAPPIAKSAQEVRSELIGIIGHERDMIKWALGDLGLTPEEREQEITTRLKRLIESEKWLLKAGEKYGGAVATIPEKQTPQEEVKSSHIPLRSVKLIRDKATGKLVPSKGEEDLVGAREDQTGIVETPVPAEASVAEEAPVVENAPVDLESFADVYKFLERESGVTVTEDFKQFFDSADKIATNENYVKEIKEKIRAGEGYKDGDEEVYNYGATKIRKQAIKFRQAFSEIMNRWSKNVSFDGQTTEDVEALGRGFCALYNELRHLPKFFDLRTKTPFRFSVFGVEGEIMETIQKEIEKYEQERGRASFTNLDRFLEEAINGFFTKRKIPLLINIPMPDTPFNLNTMVTETEPAVDRSRFKVQEVYSFTLLTTKDGHQKVITNASISTS